VARLAAELCAIAPDRWTAPFWAALIEHRLLIARCGVCGALRMPPGPFCGSCSAQPIAWDEVRGTGRVHTFTITRRAFHSALREHVPYVVAVIDLDDANGARLIGNVVGVDPERVAIGMEVRVDWDDVDETTTIARWVPAC